MEEVIWAAAAAGICIGSPRRSACGNGFCGSGVAAQIFTVPYGQTLRSPVAISTEGEAFVNPGVRLELSSSWDSGQDARYFAHRRCQILG